MLPDDLRGLIPPAPSLFRLDPDAADRWGLGPDFPVVLLGPQAFSADALPAIYDDFMDVLDELDEELFDEEQWLSERLVPLGVVGVFDEPDAPQLRPAFPHVDQLDAILAWDHARGGVVLLSAEALTDGLDDLALVADSAEALRGALRPH